MFERPALPDLITRTSTALGTDQALRRNMLTILARDLAGLSHELHGHLDWIAKQILPHTADEDFLILLAAIWSITPRPATVASGSAGGTGTNGAILPAGTLLQRSDGAEFRTAAEFVIAGGVVLPLLTAATPGLLANSSAGTILTLVSPVDGVNSSFTVAAGGLFGGTDNESPASLLQRLLDRVRRPPAGGNRYDYVTWATSVPGVARAWVLPLAQGVGTLDLLILSDLESMGSIEASPELCALVREFVAAICPNDVKYLRVRPPVFVPRDFTMSITPDTATVRTEVTAELDDLFDRMAAPGVTLPLSKINEAISLAAGETDHDLTSPAASVVHAADEFPLRGAITWL